MLTITISDTQIEQQLIDTAEATGMSLDDLARDILSRSLTAGTTPRSSDLTDKEFAAILDSMAIPGSVPVPPDTDIRELAYEE